MVEFGLGQEGQRFGALYPTAFNVDRWRQIQALDAVGNLLMGHKLKSLHVKLEFCSEADTMLKILCLMSKLRRNIRYDAEKDTLPR